VLQEDGLNKTAIGDYLGEKKDFNEAVLRDVTPYKHTSKSTIDENISFLKFLYILTFFVLHFIMTT
jgi:hypothetical protein